MQKLMKYGLFSFCVLLLVAAIIVGYSSPKATAADEKFKVAFMYVGAVGDAGWTFAHDQALVNTWNNKSPMFRPRLWSQFPRERIPKEFYPI